MTRHIIRVNSHAQTMLRLLTPMIHACCKSPGLLVHGTLCRCLSAADDNQRAPQSSRSTSVSIGTDALLRGDAMLSGSDTLSAVMAPPARLQESQLQQLCRQHFIRVEQVADR
jgi:hypothetical protein